MEKLPVPDSAKAPRTLPRREDQEYLEIMAEWNAEQDRFADHRRTTPARPRWMPCRGPRRSRPRLRRSSDDLAALRLQARSFELTAGTARRSSLSNRRTRRVGARRPNQARRRDQRAVGPVQRVRRPGRVDRASETAARRSRRSSATTTVDDRSSRARSLSAYGTCRDRRLLRAGARDYDTMLARTELSKARSSILELLSRSGPAERGGRYGGPGRRAAPARHRDPGPAGRRFRGPGQPDRTAAASVGREGRPAWRGVGERTAVTVALIQSLLREDEAVVYRSGCARPCSWWRRSPRPSARSSGGPSARDSERCSSDTSIR